MQLDRVGIALRARDSWEAIDLGTVMIRSWWRPVYAAWFAVVLPVALLLHLVLASRPWLALLLLWWLKPLYDRVVLHVLGRAVFGVTPSARETLASLGSLVRSTGLLAALTWRRVDVLRAFNLPVRQLEGQRGAAARSRERVLGRRAAGQASGLLYVCLMFELALTLSLSAVVDLVTPAALESEYGLQAFFRYLWSSDQPAWAAFLNNAFFIAAICIVEPLYVASGFALYLNRRTALEAWDLELNFRRAAARNGSAAALGLALMLALAGSSLIHDARAGQAAPASQEIIREILAAPEFQEYKTETVWRPRSTDAQSKPSDWLVELVQFLKSLSDALAEFARYAAYVAIALGAFFLLRHLARLLGRWQASASPDEAKRAPPEILFGLDVRPEALPPELAQAATAVARSDPRLALSLLYRGALATLIHRDRLSLANGDTEGDCLRRVERASPRELSIYFARLVTAWSQTAYGRRPPEATAVVALCDEWPRHFAPPA